MTDAASSAPTPASAAALLRQRDYMLYWAARFTGSMATVIQSVVIGWQVYEVSRATMSVEQAALMLGMVGLFTFVPVLLLTLPAGEVADRHTRRNVMALALLGQIAIAATLTVSAILGVKSVSLLLVMAALFGVTRAFLTPSSAAIAPMLVPRELLPRAIAWNTLAFHSATIIGPAIGGVLVAASALSAFATAAALDILALGATLFIRIDTKPETQPGSRWTLMKEGLKYVWNEKIVFGAISLDLAAVLLAAATAVLPVFARDILHVGPEGFGLLRAAPAIGATLVGLYLASFSIPGSAGKVMFGGVAVFAIMTIVFGLSRSLWLSVAALAILGGADMLSVYVRQTLVQLVTPDAMRGRVAAVSGLFIGASNELGEFRAGVSARFIGPIASVVVGGIAALAVTAAWIKLYPALWKADRLA